MADNVPRSMSLVLVVVPALLGLVLLGWGVTGLYTSPAVDLGESRVECRSVTASPDATGVAEVRVDGETVTDDPEPEEVHACDQARGGRLARAVQTGLGGVLALGVAVGLARRRREFLS
ncbi:hypothetical protein GCM10023340_18220 [Nocardioides marinquilinus]|uniref:Uncharacterized protein n=1 Tax=Nocardioides marinquilinus TaxID=1210400 RepID=A0ABP9PHQ1_9ACTN